jgi:uncharacterized protein YqgV (UPF0045/DUF77 family)
MLKYTYTSDLELDDNYSIVAEIENEDAKIIAGVYKKVDGNYYINVYPTETTIELDIEELLRILEKIKLELKDYRF